MDEDTTEVIAVRDSLLMANAELFRDEVGRALIRGRKRLLIDLRRCQTIDSTGLGALVWARTSARREGGDVKLANTNEAVMSRLRAASLTNVLLVVDAR